MPGIFLGVDVGGTTTAAGLVTAEGEVLVEEQASTHGGGAGGALETITALIASLREPAAARRVTVAGVGVGVPGIVDPTTGRIGEGHHVPELTGVALASVLRERLGAPVFVDNDVNALALGEWTFGVARAARSLVLLAPGTGFGAAVILDGRLVRGAAGFGGELGHAPVKFDGPPCWCGGRGCLALYASGRGIAEAARAHAMSPEGAGLVAAAGGEPGAIDAPLVFRLAAAGDAAAGAIVDDACRALGAMIAIVVNGLNPEMVVVTGGVAAAFAALGRRVLAAAADHAFARALGGTAIRFVPGDKRVTMRGAAALAIYETGGAGRTPRTPPFG